MGFFFPSALTGYESPRLSYGKLSDLIRRISQYLPTGPNLSATVPLTGFLNLPATLLLSKPSHHFQIGGTHGIAPSRDLFLSRSIQ
jgi:hypothetical protein